VPSDDQTLDLRTVRKPDRHPMVFAAYRSLTAGESLTLINDHDPRHLRDEFDADHAGTFDWTYLSRERGDWQIRITKLTTTPLPRELCNSSDYGVDADRTADPDARGALWRLEVQDRDLDANLIALPPHGSIGRHAGPDLDVLVHVVSGSGQLSTERGAVDLTPGSLIWLPKRSIREFSAGPQGLRYLTVHQRRTDALTIKPVERR
jgi:uncharacterized protein (DUF2249 family)/quercetin dioxygenase-like cupin family protein